MDLQEQLLNLRMRLDEFATTDAIPWPVAQMFNAVLEEVKRAAPDDRVVAMMEPIEHDPGGSFGVAQCGTALAMVVQMQGLVF